MAVGFPKIRFVGGCTSWATSGNAPVMCCRPIRTERKKRHIRRRLKNRGFRSITLFEDETDLLLFPPLRAAWSLRGQAAPVPISAANAKRVICGSIIIRTCSPLILHQKNHKAESVQACSELV